MSLKEILEFNFISIGDFNLSLYHLIAALSILLLARLLVTLTGKLIGRYFKKKQVDEGRRYAIFQVLKYIIYTAALLMAMEAMGISLSLLLGGAAALMVGIGLGLQQTFNDLISGIILLIEGSVEVGDILEVDSVVGKVIEIGIRTSKVETRNKISIVIPNSKLVDDKAINWSHNKAPTRFGIDVGVSYVSDVDLVTRLLLQAVNEHNDVLKDPSPRVQFKDFGSSSLDFTVWFFSYHYFPIEFVKSDIRYRITKLFRENDVEIPFPQQDLWLRNPEDLRANM